MVVAQESIQILRKLMQDDPNTPPPGLAQSLHNLGMSLRGLGRYEENLEVELGDSQIRQDLAMVDSRPP